MSLTETNKLSGHEKQTIVPETTASDGFLLGVRSSLQLRNLLVLLPQKGERLSMSKVSVQNGATKVASGTTLEGLLMDTIAIGKPIILQNGGRTSRVVDISLLNGAMHIQTETSVYKIHDAERPSSMVDRIKQTLHLQPASTQNLLRMCPNEFIHEEVIGGYYYLFTARTKDKALALVETSDGRYVPRGFRYSTSDMEWKALPATLDGGQRYSKGRETEKGHHYVQDTKLDERMKSCILALPEEAQLRASLSAFLPRIEADTQRSSFLEDYSYLNEQKLANFKDPEWKSFQKNMQYYYEWYLLLNFRWQKGERTFAKYEESGKESEFSIMLRGFGKQFPMGKELREEYDGFMEEYEKLCATVQPQYLRGTNFGNPVMSSFAVKYKEFFGKFLQKLFSAIRFPKNFVPDYTKPPIDAQLGQDGTMRRRYAVTSKGGDSMVWTIAESRTGDKWVDDLSEENAKMNSYGTRRDLYNVGFLVYKPTDYEQQTAAILEEDLGPKKGSYRNVNALWRRLAPLQ